jgi:hypothetical protein
MHQLDALLCLVPATTWAQVDPLKPKPFLHQQSNHKVVYSLKIKSDLSELSIVIGKSLACRAYAGQEPA